MFVFYADVYNNIALYSDILSSVHCLGTSSIVWLFVLMFLVDTQKPNSSTLEVNGSPISNISKNFDDPNE